MRDKLEKLLRKVNPPVAREIWNLFDKFPKGFHFQEAEYLILSPDYTWRVVDSTAVVFSDMPYDALVEEEKRELLEEWGRKHLHISEGDEVRLYAIKYAPKEDNE